MTDASLTAADRDLSDVTAASLSSFGDPVISSSGISDRAIYYGVSLLLRDRVGVRAYFSFPQGTEGISVRDADLGTDLPITMVGNLGYVTLSDISFSRLGENRHRGKPQCKGRWLFGWLSDTLGQSLTILL
jgi:hypothetical protein